MARIRIPQYIMRPEPRKTAPFHKIPIEIFDMILTYLPKKADKISILLSCRLFLRALTAQKIDVPRGVRTRHAIIRQVGSGSNTDSWGYCYTCSLLRPIIPSKWAGGQTVPCLPDEYSDLVVSDSVRDLYYAYCNSWTYTFPTTLRPGRSRDGRMCPECYLRDRKENHALAIDFVFVPSNALY